MLKKRLRIFEADDHKEDTPESKEKANLIKKLKSMKPTDVIKLLASNDAEVVEKLEQGTEPYRLWVDTLESLNTAEAISTKQVVTNIRKLKSYVKKQKNLLPFDDDDSEISDSQEDVNPTTTGKRRPSKTILDNKGVQDLLCEATRSFVLNVKQEFGNILLAFSARLIGLMEQLGYSNPARGAFYLVDDNSTSICSAIINAVRDYTESTPSVVGVQIERNTTDKRSLGLAHGVPTTLIADLMKVFDEEVITNPEDVISLDSNDQEVINVASAINLSDLIHVNKSRKTADGNTIYCAFRMQKGGYSTNFNFGMQIIPLTDASFNVLYYMYLADKNTKPEGQLTCSEWI